jgi:hypothetical protein
MFAAMQLLAKIKKMSATVYFKPERSSVEQSVAGGGLGGGGVVR